MKSIEEGIIFQIQYYGHLLCVPGTLVGVRRPPVVRPSVVRKKHVLRTRQAD